MENIEGEWCVAYHGLCAGQESNDVKKFSRLLAIGGEKGEVLKAGKRQAHKDCKDLFYQNHPGEYDKDNKVGTGVYVTPKIKITIDEDYAGISTINGVDYYTVLMVRVNPKSIRHCRCVDAKDYWVINGSPEEIRPYRILYKKIEDDEEKEEEEKEEEEEEKEEEEEEGKDI